MSNYAALALLCSLLWARQAAGCDATFMCFISLVAAEHLSLSSSLHSPPPKYSTAPPEGLGVFQFPTRLTVIRGETASLSCYFQVGSLTHGVTWFIRDESGRWPIPKSSPRHVQQEKNQSSQLLISEAGLMDSGTYYCEVIVKLRDPERGNGTELIVLAPPSAPRLYLQTPADPLLEPFSLVCVTGGFYPSDLSLLWTNRSARGPIDRLSISNCTLSPASDPSQTPQCLQLSDLQSSEAHLFSLIPLPDRRALETGVTYTCAVEGHPAMTAPLTASYTWEAPPNRLIGALNIFKMCFLSAVIAVFSLEAVKHLHR